MKIIKAILVWALSIINTIAVVLMAVCAYSVYLHPVHFPNWSYLGMIFPAFVIITICFIPIWLLLKWKNCLISILGMVVCWGSIRDYCPVNLMQGKPEGKTIKMLSYNVYMFGQWTDNDWDESVIANYIVDSDADIVCLQEAANISNEIINEKLTSAYPYIKMGNAKDSPTVLLSKYPILDIDSIQYSTISGSSYIYNVNVDGDTIAVINNHLESYQLTNEDKELYKKLNKESAGQIKDDAGELGADTAKFDAKQTFWMLEEKVAAATSIRATQADLLAETIENCKQKYIIVCGDFNDSPVSYVHHKLTSGKLHDAYTEAGNGPGWSYNKNGMYFRIDNILISENMRSYRAKVEKTSKESDHYPIFCTLELL